MPTRPPYSSISFESPVEVKDGGLPLPEDFEGPREKPSSTTLELFGTYSVAGADSAAVLERGATANLACLFWSGNRNSVLKKVGVPPVQTSPARAKCDMQLLFLWEAPASVAILRPSRRMRTLQRYYEKERRRPRVATRISPATSWHWADWG